jgi:tol-pal system protein YbgF
MSAAGSGADTGDGSPELLIYDAAVRDFARGSYTMARSGFEEMLRRFPRSQLADNAAFWLAETLYAEGQFQQSLARFEQLLRDYPWTDVRLSALLKSGYCHLELGDTNGAAKAFRRIMLEDPGSDEAAIAEHKLEAMGESGTAEGPRE